MKILHPEHKVSSGQVVFDSLAAHYINLPKELDDIQERNDREGTEMDNSVLRIAELWHGLCGNNSRSQLASVST